LRMEKWNEKWLRKIILKKWKYSFRRLGK